MRRITFDAKSLHKLDNVSHYDLHDAIRNILQEHLDEISKIISAWNIYHIVLEQEERYYKQNCKLETTGDKHTYILSGYQLTYIRRKVDNSFYNLAKTMNEMANKNKQSFKKLNHVIKLINRHLHAAECGYADESEDTLIEPEEFRPTA